MMQTHVTQIPDFTLFCRQRELLRDLPNEAPQWVLRAIDLLESKAFQERAHSVPEYKNTVAERKLLFLTCFKKAEVRTAHTIEFPCHASREPAAAGVSTYQPVLFSFVLTVLPLYDPTRKRQSQESACMHAGFMIAAFCPFALPNQVMAANPERLRHLQKLSRCRQEAKGHKMVHAFRYPDCLGIVMSEPIRWGAPQWTP
jgi:hypothetical protein